MTIWKQLIHNATRLSESLYQFASRPILFFKALLNTRQYVLIAGWGNQGGKLLSDLSPEPRRPRRHGPGRWAEMRCPHSGGSGLRAHEPALFPTPPPHTSCVSLVMNYFYAVMSETQGGAVAIGTSPKGQFLAASLSIYTFHHLGSERCFPWNQLVIFGVNS